MIGTSVMKEIGTPVVNVPVSKLKKNEFSHTFFKFGNTFATSFKNLAYSQSTGTLIIASSDSYDSNTLCSFFGVALLDASKLTKPFIIQILLGTFMMKL